MEIIHHGTKDLATCGKCGSQMRYEKSDMQLNYAPIKGYYYHDEVEPEDGYHAYIICPVCRTSINVNTNRGMRRELIDYHRQLEIERFERDHHL